MSGDSHLSVTCFISGIFGCEQRHQYVAAAKTLHVSQSAVSQALQKLESEIKCPLFTRLHKRLVPTAAGERLFAIVRPFMAELDACLKTLEQAKNKPFGELRIGAPVEFGKAYFPAISAAFREQYPDVTFYLKFGDAGTLLPMVEKGQLDFALVDEFLILNRFFGNIDIYHFTPIVEEKVILACSRQSIITWAWAPSHRTWSKKKFKMVKSSPSTLQNPRSLTKYPWSSCRIRSRPLLKKCSKIFWWIKSNQWISESVLTN